MSPRTSCIERRHSFGYQHFCPKSLDVSFWVTFSYEWRHFRDQEVGRYQLLHDSPSERMTFLLLCISSRALRSQKLLCFLNQVCSSLLHFCNCSCRRNDSSRRWRDSTDSFCNLSHLASISSWSLSSSACHQACSPSTCFRIAPFLALSSQCVA